jgi:hypothetical protein
MSVDGTYNIVINSPMGAQKVTLTLKASGNTLTGSQAGAQGTMDISEGKVDGNNVSWSANITSPMPMKLETTGTVEGNKISGNVKAGAFGSFPFSGERA